MFLVDVFRRRHATEQVSRKLARARHSGVGLYLNEWFLSTEDITRTSAEATVERILEWCRHTVAQCRRPWGIDHFDVALACSHPELPQVRSLRLRRVRPAELYTDDGLAVRLVEWLPWIEPRDTASPSQPVKMAVALFSWGDAAHSALPATR